MHDERANLHLLLEPVPRVQLLPLPRPHQDPEGPLLPWQEKDEVVLLLLYLSRSSVHSGHKE